MKNSLLTLLLAAILSAGCGGDKDQPTASTNGDVAALSKVLVESMKTAFLASLLSDTTSVVGVKGAIQIEGENWTFVGYSPDDKLVIDGLLVVEKSKYPDIPAKGTLQLSGTQVGALKVDMMVKVDGLKILSTGTFELNGQVYDVAQLVGAGSSTG